MKALFSAVTLMMFLTTPTALALSATQSVLKEVRTTTPSGEIATRYIDATLVIPGETVVYRLDYINDQEAPVTDMVLTMPVPAEVTFQDGSADQNGVDTYFSADGGQSFSARAALLVDTGDGIMAPARSEDITHVRWISSRPLPVKADGILQFKAVLK